jgi:hypothetical protein
LGTVSGVEGGDFGWRDRAIHFCWSAADHQGAKDNGDERE